MEVNEEFKHKMKRRSVEIMKKAKKLAELAGEESEPSFPAIHPRTTAYAPRSYCRGIENASDKEGCRCLHQGAGFLP